MFRLFACVFAIILGGCQSISEISSSEMQAVSWLAGSWVNESGNSVSEEIWLDPFGGAMLGINRTIANGRMVFFEYLRIEETKDGYVYLASPKGRHPPTSFQLVESGTNRLVFENPNHDFPQRIIYERVDENELRASIEGTQNGKPHTERWRWIRSK